VVRNRSLTVLVTHGGADPPAVIATIRSIVACGEADHVLVAPGYPGSGSPVPEDDGPTVPGGDGPTSVTLLDGASSPLDVLVKSSSRYIAVVPAGTLVGAGGLERHLQALDAHADAVVSATFAGPGDGDSAPRTRSLLASVADGTDPPVLDGREFARALLADGWPIGTVPSLVAIRTSAVDRSSRGGLSDGGRPGDGDGDLCGAVLATLTRGTVWCDLEASITAGGRPTPPALPSWRLWRTALHHAVRLGLLDEPGEAVAMLVAQTRRTARQLGRAASGTPGTRIDDVREALEAWRAFVADEAASGTTLPLQAVVVPDGDRGDETVTVEAAARVGIPSSVLDPRLAVAAEDMLGGSLPPTGDLARLLARCDVPLLMMRSGETPEVADRLQLAAVLEDHGVDRPYGAIATPSGPQRRLVAPRSPVPAPGGTVGAEHLHSLRIGSIRAGDRPDWLPPSVLRPLPHRFTEFAVVAPDYTEIHGGVVALHRLCDRLNAIGYRAYIHPIGAEGAIRPGWRTPLRRGRLLRDAVMVYPEIVTGNPFGSTLVVRWLLNRPSWFTGHPMDEGPDDLLVTFNAQITADHDVVSVPLIDPSTFFPKDRPGSGRLLWIGKGTLPDEFDRSDMTLVTNSWPATRQALASLLRRADTLYTCDWLTSLIDEALMCATPVVLVGDQAWDRDEVTPRPGMTWGADPDLDGARRDVVTYYDQYLDSLRTVDVGIEHFVQLVNDHFGALDRSAPTPSSGPDVG